MNKFRLRAYLLLLIGAVISGIAGPVIKLTLERLPFDVFLFYRFFVSSVVVLFLLPFVKFKLPKKGTVLVDFFIYGFLNSTVALTFLFLGTSKTSLLDMSLISVFGPIITIALGFLFLHDHLTKREKLGILISFVGSLIILVGPFLANGDGVGQITGNILVVLALVAGSISTIYLKRLLRVGVNPITLVNGSFVIGFLSFLVYLAFKGAIPASLVIIKGLPINYHLGVLYMAIFSGTIAYSLGNIAQKSIEVSEAAVFAYIYPVISAILAIILLGEHLTFIIFLGSVITFVGVFLAEWKKKRYN